MGGAAFAGIDLGRTKVAGASESDDYLIRGRCLLADGSEYGIEAYEVSLASFQMVCPVDVAVGSIVICYLDGIGIIPGQVISEGARRRFRVRPSIPQARRPTVNSRIEWHVGQEVAHREQRSAERIVPRHTKVLVHLGAKLVFRGTVLDVSRTGAAIALNPGFCPFVGSTVRTGRREAIVVRLLPNGLAVHFKTAILRDAFDENIIL